MSAPQRELDRAATRARVRALRAECQLIDASLPSVGPWHGPANAMYRLRLARVRLRLGAALAAIEAAELAL
ncbi:hypothetical protein ACFOYW_11150 [Gryllotalpicola reticulitermitis]|uniref:CHAD domain-containing protein n=1 Tax=Gryllotalpicola reticulitermitis TaxID=1184153 RepID=A0ABV8Q8F3_9MICO